MTLYNSCKVLDDIFLGLRELQPASSVKNKGMTYIMLNSFILTKMNQILKIIMFVGKDNLCWILIKN